MNQVSTIPFGNNVNVIAGYAQVVNDRLGAFDLVVENTGANSLYLLLKEYDGSTSPSGFKNLGAANTVVAGGTKTISLSLLSKTIGFFGSGNTVANISTVQRNPGNLRGAQIDIKVGGRFGYAFDPAFDQNSFLPGEFRQKQ